MSKVAIIGGGAAGMLCGVYAARRGHQVHILEKNEKLGKKLFITGKGRCNVTNDSDTEELFPAVMSNRKFLYSAFYTYGSRDVMEFFEEAGVPLKTERGNRVFPVSDHSSDIIRALERELKKAGAQIHLHTEVKEVCTQDEKVTGVLLSDGTFFEADTVVVATGGLFLPGPQVPQEMDIVLLLKRDIKLFPSHHHWYHWWQKKIMSPNFRAFPFGMWSLQ